MEQLSLWFNILAFTILFASLGLAYIRFIQNPSPWLTWYQLYMGGFLFWLLLATYTFFRIVYLKSPPVWLELGINWARIGMSYYLLLIVPEAFTRLRGKRWPWWAHVSTFAALTLGIWFLLKQPSLLVSGFVSGFYNLFFTALSLWAIRGQGLPKFIRSFLILSSLYYLLFTVLNFFLAFYPLPILLSLSTLIIGVFCLSWGINDLIWFLRDWKTGSPHGNREMGRKANYKRWKISDREGEIIRCMEAGATNKEIADKLCVSLRTVETHLYNIYRKAGVKNRVELLHKLNKPGGM